MVTVRFFAAAAQAAGCRETRGAWSGMTAAALLALLQEEYPALRSLGAALAVAVNREYSPGETVLQDGDEVALLPPVSGGAGAVPDGAPLFAVTERPLVADEVAARVTNERSGATLVFLGTVREWTKGRRTVLLEYEAYPEMAEAQMRRIGEEIAARWPGTRTAIVHRVGRLAIGETSVVIATASPHRADSFEACRYAIERLKQIVPIWKKEVWEDGEEWVGSQSGPDWMHEREKA
jgi:MoaE-MoaD fusion protein